MRQVHITSLTEVSTDLHMWMPSLRQINSISTHAVLPNRLRPRVISAHAVPNGLSSKPALSMGIHSCSQEKASLRLGFPLQAQGQKLC